MRVGLLTTDEVHHLHFSAMLCEMDSLVAVVLESSMRESRYSTFHPLETVRDEYERSYFFDDKVPQFSDMTAVHETNSINNPLTLGWLNQFRLDLIVVFGTRRLIRKTIAIPSLACLNLHGGNPEMYRGLDSHYWTIYHSDFDNLVTTIHHVDENYDTGPLVSSRKLQIAPYMELHQLRSINTDACVVLTGEVLEGIADGRGVESISQRQSGRYYSAMPTVLKDCCKTKFDRYVQGINQDLD